MDAIGLLIEMLEDRAREAELAGERKGNLMYDDPESKGYEVGFERGRANAYGACVGLLKKYGGEQ